jgi:hypothetical protein
VASSGVHLTCSGCGGGGSSSSGSSSSSGGGMHTRLPPLAHSMMK